jgi:hypothetical protein
VTADRQGHKARREWSARKVKRDRPGRKGLPVREVRLEHRAPSGPKECKVTRAKLDRPDCKGPRALAARLDQSDLQARQGFREW